MALPLHEKSLGQLFCDESAQDIVDMLLSECEKGSVDFRLRSEILSVSKSERGFLVQMANGEIEADSVVVATGGLSMPGLGASPFGYRLAESFGIPVLPTRAGLVPFTLHKPLLTQLETLAGVSVPVVVTVPDGTSFKESLLFTHRGLSGPAILQVSSYWQGGETVSINLLPDLDVDDFFQRSREEHPNQSVKNTLARCLPKRLVECLQALDIVPDVALNQLSAVRRQALVETLTDWRIQPNGTEGYRTAEVTLGGVDTDALSSKTMEATKVLWTLLYW